MKNTLSCPVSVNLPKAQLPFCLREQRVVVVDVETTGFSSKKDRVIELGLLWVEDGQVVLEMSKLFNPGCLLPEAIVNITGIQQAEVDQAGSFSEIVDFLIEVTEPPAVVVAYNSPFDFGFLREEVCRCGKILNIGPYVDPLPWVRVEDRGKKCSLTEAACRRGVSVLNAHRALADCKVTLEVLNKLKLPDTLEAVLEQQRRIGTGLRAV